MSNSDNFSGWSRISGDERSLPLNIGTDRDGAPVDPTYINPDKLYQVGGEKYNITTFIYEPKLGLLFDDGNLSHFDMLRKLDNQLDDAIGDLTNANPKVFQTFLHVDKLLTLFRYQFPEFAKRALLGRCGPKNRATHLDDDDSFLVTFWNDDPDVYRELLTDCMLALYDDEIIYDPVLLSTPAWGTKPYGAAETQTMGQDPTPAVNKQDLEKMRQLHLMRADEKKKAMQELGLSTASQKHPMQAALEKGGHINPGQKWWAPTSESLFNKKLNIILAEIHK